MGSDAKAISVKLNDSGLIRSHGLIGGKWTEAYDGKTLEVLNPATGEVITTVPFMAGQETNDAIASAQEAFALYSIVARLTQRTEPAVARS